MNQPLDEDDINTLTAKVRKARCHVNTVSRDVEKDKQRRAESWLLRFVDALITTGAEAELNNAQSQLAKVTENARNSAHAWIIAKSAQNLAENPTDVRLHQEQKQRLECAIRRHLKLAHWFNLAQDADDKLSAVCNACKSASTSEMLDLFSSNKAFSALSYIDTSSASDTVKKASQAVRALSEALPKRAQDGNIEQLDDLFDLVVDITFDPSIDVFSLFNMNKLDEAASHCEQVSKNLRPLLIRIGQLYEESQNRINHEMTMLRNIEAPYLKAVSARISSELDVPTPNGFN